MAQTRSLDYLGLPNGAGHEVGILLGDFRRPGLEGFLRASDLFGNFPNGCQQDYRGGLEVQCMDSSSAELFKKRRAPRWWPPPLISIYVVWAYLASQPHRSVCNPKVLTYSRSLTGTLEQNEVPNGTE